MKFFMPHAKDEKQAEEVFAAVVKFASVNVGGPILPYRIYRLTSRHDGDVYQAEVGKAELRNGTPQNDPVLAIIESETTYMTCTPSRGVIRGMPFITGKPVMSVEYFEDYAPAGSIGVNRSIGVNP